MSVSVRMILRSPVMVGACITALVTVAGTVYAVTRSRQSEMSSNSVAVVQTHEKTCTTVVFDPEPPTNVRSTPIEQTGNIVSKLQNNEVLTVVGEENGWLRISAPATGWIYEKLTKTSCSDAPPPAVLTQKTDLMPASLPTGDPGSQIYQKAVSHFQSGNLKGAIALARAVPMDSSAYDQAQKALKTMPQAWTQAESKYNIAQQAMEDNRWRDILKIATEFPDIRFWREKLAPIVKKAIRVEYSTSNTGIQ